MTRSCTAATAQRLDHVVEAGRGDFHLDAGADHRRAEGGSLLGGETSHLADRARTLDEVHKLGASACGVVAEVVERVGQLQHFGLRKPESSSHLCHCLASFVGGHVEGDSHLRHVNSKGANFIPGDAGLPSRRVDGREARGSNRHLAREADDLRANFLQSLRRFQAAQDFADVSDSRLKLDGSSDAAAQRQEEPASGHGSPLPGGRVNHALEGLLGLHGSTVGPLQAGGQLRDPFIADLGRDPENRLQVECHASACRLSIQ